MSAQGGSDANLTARLARDGLDPRSSLAKLVSSGGQLHANPLLRPEAGDRPQHGRAAPANRQCAHSGPQTPTMRSQPARTAAMAVAGVVIGWQNDGREIAGRAFGG